MNLHKKQKYQLIGFNKFGGSMKRRIARTTAYAMIVLMLSGCGAATDKQEVDSISENKQVSTNDSGSINSEKDGLQSNGTLSADESAIDGQNAAQNSESDAAAQSTVSGSDTQGAEAGTTSQDPFGQNNDQSSTQTGNDISSSGEGTDTGSAVNKKTKTRKESFMDALYKYKEAQDGEYSMDQVLDMNLDTELVQYGWPYAAVNENAKYLFYDLDSDGQDELIITYYSDIIDIYGYDGEKARLIYSNPYRGITSLFPDGMLRLDYGISADYYNNTWYQYDSNLGDFFAVYQQQHNPENGTIYHTLGYYNIDEESYKELEKSYREDGIYPVWLGEWKEELTEAQYEKIAPNTEPIKLPEGEPISKIALPTDYESQLIAETTLKPGETLESRLLETAGVTKDKIQFFHEDDFDGDGQQEAFALIGEKSDIDWTVPIVEGDVWFVSPKQCKKLHKNEGMGFGGEDRTMKLGNLTYIMFDEQYATGVRTDVWYVSNGRASDPWFTERGYIIPEENDNEHFCIEDSSYDCMYDPDVKGMLGHTWKYYYFYYDPLYGLVQEYGGTEIDKATVTEVCGKDIISELIPSGDQIDTIYYRDNGQIIINFAHKEDGYIYYYHYIYNLPRECLVDDTGMETGKEPLEGVVLKALCPEMANYPEKPKGSDWYGH